MIPVRKHRINWRGLSIVVAVVVFIVGGISMALLHMGKPSGTTPPRTEQRKSASQEPSATPSDDATPSRTVQIKPMPQEPSHTSASAAPRTRTVRLTLSVKGNRVQGKIFDANKGDEERLDLAFDGRQVGPAVTGNGLVEFNATSEPKNHTATLTAYINGRKVGVAKVRIGGSDRTVEVSATREGSRITHLTGYALVPTAPHDMEMYLLLVDPKQSEDQQRQVLKTASGAAFGAMLVPEHFAPVAITGSNSVEVKVNSFAPPVPAGEEVPPPTQEVDAQLYFDALKG